MKKSFTIWFLVGMTFLLLGFIQPAQAQSSFRLKNKAEYLLRQGYIYEALPVLEKYCIKKPKDVKAALLLANKLAEVRDYYKASDWYLFVYQSDTVEFRDQLFQYARMQKMVGAYENSLSAFRMLEQLYKGRGVGREQKKMLEIEIAGCLLADSLRKNQEEIILRLMDTSINKMYSEFSPVMINDSTLIYGGMLSNQIVYTNNNLPVKQFYTASKKNERWTFEGRWDFLEETPDEITGNGVFSRDKKRFYFTRCAKNLDQQITCQIYRKQLLDNQWGVAERLKADINLTNYTSTHPAIAGEPGNAKKEILYFISNRPDGEGGFDIYYTVYSITKDEYSEVKNAGKKINTAGDEYTLFVDPGSERLYFSSTGWPGIGGFDIFKVMGSKREWTQPENMGMPFNSNADDLYFSTGTNPQEGFFVSNRKGGIAYQDFSCCDDIYQYKWKKYINVVVKGSIAQTMGQNQLDILPTLRNPRIKLLVMDRASGEYVLADEKAILTDTFNVNLEADEIYRLLVEADNYSPKSFDVSTREYELSDTLNLRFNLEVKPEMPIVLEDILFGYDSYELNDVSMNFLDTKLIPILHDKPGIRIEISAHTDNKGNNSYNQELSQKRAESVMNYIISKGIDQKRLEAVGYGESRPIEPNEFEDGNDNPEGRSRNRRVEMKIIK